MFDDEEDNLLLIIVSIDDFNVINESSANKKEGNLSLLLC